jgi:hypothetical protein
MNFKLLIFCLLAACALSLHLQSQNHLNSTVVTCDPPALFNSSTGKCDCKNGSVLDTATSKCVCPKESPYLINGSCIACALPSYFDATRIQCVRCEPPTVYNQTTGSCQPCTGGSVFDTRSLTCACPADKKYKYNDKCN